MNSSEKNQVMDGHAVRSIKTTIQIIGLFFIFVVTSFKIENK